MIPRELREVAERWRADVQAELSWKRDPKRSANPGEAGGFFVRAAGFQHPAYLKPTKICADDHPRAANEKIVSDLAFELGLPVPPVLLFRREDCPDGEEPRACIVLVMYPEQYDWGEIWQVPDGLALQVVRTSLARASGVVALDTWIGNKDRKNRRNAIFGVSPGAQSESGWVFLDSSNSLNHQDRWKDGKWNQVSPAPMPDIMRDSVDPQVLEDYLQEIEGMDEETISEIVNRLPEEYVTPEHREVILEGLLGRREMLRPTLKQAFGLHEGGKP